MISLLVMVVIVVLYFSFSRDVDSEELRRRKLATLARKLQLQFKAKADFELARHYLFLRWLKRGDISYAYNVFRGGYLAYPVTLFDYTFAAGKCSYYWSAYVLEMSANFPDLLITHESMESRIAEVLGKPHIAFESAEFSRTFRVRTADKKFAFDVCHPGMMEFLLANRDLTIEIRGTALAVLFEDWLHPEKVEHNLARLVETRKLLPDYLFAKT